tara:strand:+ start:308 stop:1129 length:822 start_codon:yes stop_codon:yes gene_type:complete
MNKEEKLLRENIRNAIKIIQNKKRTAQREMLKEEHALRNVIRLLLKEEAVADFAPNQSTGINVLEELLKKIIPVLEEDFKSLTTNKEQRDSFRAHIVNGIEDLLAPAEVNADAPTPGEKDALKELLNTLDELEVTVGGDEDMPEEFIDISGDEKSEEETPSTEEEEFGSKIADRDYNLTGRNMALRSFKKIRQNILDSYDVLGDDEDREIFYDYLITNVKLYFDRFENELEPMVAEPTTPEYDEKAAGEEEAEGEFNLNEYIDLDGLLEGLHR